MASPTTTGMQEIRDLVGKHHDYTTATESINSVVLTRKHPLVWLATLLVSFIGCLVLLGSVILLIGKGTGIWGINNPVGWGFAIINFVWWIGIGHAGTLISAVLFLFKQPWRTSINRFAEAMTIFAVMCAGMYPILHLGRPWLFYWLLPYPNVMGMWPQFRSPLMWDVFAVSTYFTISLVFWYTGLIPDFASLRDQAKGRWQQRIYGFFSLGWIGSARDWNRYEIVYLILAGISTPLVLSVHSIVSLDFAVSQLPGWHTTIFPPYFVAGAIFSGFAMVLTLAIPVRSWYGLKDIITLRHLDAMSKVMLATGLLVVYGYANEAFFAWYSGNPYERYMMWNRMTGPYALGYWMLILCNGVIPQLLWIPKIRVSPVPLFFISIVINIGMWLERFEIVITSLHRDFLSSSWDMYYPTRWDWLTYLGTIGFFFFMMMLFIRFVPMVAAFEIRELIHRIKSGHSH